MSNPRKPKKVNFGPIRIFPETVAELHKAAAGNRSAASIVRELVEAWANERKKKGTQ